MNQPEASPRVIRSLRQLADDVGRAFLYDELHLDSGACSRILQSIRDDKQAIRPTLGFAEQVLQRARADVDADGRRARVEEVLSALVGEPVKLALPDSQSAIGRAPTVTVDDAFQRFCTVAGELGALVTDGSSVFADHRVSPEEAERQIRLWLDARAAGDRYAEALQAAARRG